MTHEDAQGAEGKGEGEADEGEPPSADGADSPVVGRKAAWNPRYIGNWVQESIEADKLDAILKIQGYNYPTRKIVTSVKMAMTFTRDSDGDLFLVMKDPANTHRLKCIDGANLVTKNMGVTLKITAQWEAGNLVVNLETHKGKTVTTAKITQRYDPATDKIYSENDSIEGFYVRTFKRSKKGPQAGDELPPMVPLAELMVSEESHTKRRGAAPPPNNVYENLPGARGQASTARADDAGNHGQASTARADDAGNHGQASTARADDAGNRSARAMVTHEDAQGEEESEDEADEDEPPSANGADQVAERESEQDADEAQPPSADEPSDDGGAVMGGKAAWNPRYIGNWVQESIEADKLDAILKIQGYNYPTRKIVTSVKMAMTFTRDSDGDLFLVMKDPANTHRLKCIDGANLVTKNMGVTLKITAQWEAGNLVVNLETHKGKTVTTAKITQRYDPATDKIYSENDSIEGFYVRTFKRSKKGPQAGDQ